MFKINDSVIYGGTGLCVVSEYKNIIVDNIEKKYYVLLPADGRGMVYVPVEGSEERLRPLISKVKAEKILENIPDMEFFWIENDAARKNVFRNIIMKADMEELVGLLKSLWICAVDKKAHGKKVHVSDEKMMNEAEKTVIQELSAVLNVLPEEVKEIIYAKFNEIK